MTGQVSRREYYYNMEKLGDVEVILSPVEGDAELYVNPGFFQKDYTKSMYKLAGKANKRIIIPEFDLKAMNLTNKVRSCPLL